MQDTEEIWKDVVGYEGLYQVSNRGNVIKTEEWRKRKRKLSFSHGYPQTSISKGVKTRKVVSVHRLVAQAFIPNPDNKPDVNHINHNRSDNRVENLEWCTTSENLLHAAKCGRMKRKANFRNLSSDERERILHLRHNHNFSQYKIASMFNVTQSCIHLVIKKSAWNYAQQIGYLKKVLRESAY